MLWPKGMGRLRKRRPNSEQPPLSQIRSGLGLDAQKAAVADRLNGGRWQIAGEFAEIESGKKSDRPELVKALGACKRHKATLVIARLDRLARNVHFISGLMETKVKFVACDMPEATPFMLHIYAAVAEQEARAISARTKVALQAAKQRGVRLGRTGAEILAPKYHAEALDRAKQLEPSFVRCKTRVIRFGVWRPSSPIGR